MLLPPDGYEPRRGNPTLGTATWPPDFSRSFLQGDEGPSRGLKYHECDGRGLQILSRSRDEVLGFELLQFTPQCGAVISTGEQTPGGYKAGSLGEEFHKITGTVDSLIPSFN